MQKNIIIISVLFILASIVVGGSGCMNGSEKSKVEEYLENKYNEEFSVKNSTTLLSKATGEGIKASAYPISNKSLTFDVEEYVTNGIGDDAKRILIDNYPEKIAEYELTNLYRDAFDALNISCILKLEADIPIDADESKDLYNGMYIGNDIKKDDLKGYVQNGPYKDLDGMIIISEDALADVNFGEAIKTVFAEVLDGIGAMPHNLDSSIYVVKKSAYKEYDEKTINWTLIRNKDVLCYFWYGEVIGNPDGAPQKYSADEMNTMLREQHTDTFFNPN